VPVVLNTSFNENEPIVNTPDEALACFERTGLDRLVLGDWVAERLEPRAPPFLSATRCPDAPPPERRRPPR
jgi:hypothetical protein